MAGSYIQAYRDGRLARKTERALKWLRKCTLCPRMCAVNRLEGESGFCRTGRYAVLSSFGPHYGEESPLVGRNGSGTIFFTHCNLFCIFCQNWDVSHEGRGTQAGPEQLAKLMLRLQEQGCHNINFVTPSHMIAQILEALPVAVEGGLTVPLVYNCGGYDGVPALKLLDGIVDIYMPDFKFWSPETAGEMCTAPDYPERARESLKEMHRQVGDLQVNREGVATRGLLVRHLVMPNDLAGSRKIFDFIAREISKNTYINVMGQYHPSGYAVGRKDIGRRPSGKEMIEAMQAARNAGLNRLDERRARWFEF